MKVYIFFDVQKEKKLIYLIFSSKFRADKFGEKNGHLIREEWEVIN
jgi:hypothetical protein